MIPKGKDEIGRGLAEFVQQNFLDPTNLRNWLTNAEVSRRIATWLDTSDHSALAARRGIETAATIAVSLDDEQVASVVTQTTLDWMRQTAVTPLISLVVDAWLKDGRTREAIEATLRGIEVVLVDNLPYFRDSFARSAPWWVPSWAGSLIFERIIASFRILVEDMAADPGHPIRSDIDEMLAKLADDLRNSADLAERIEESKLGILDSPELAAAIQSQWQLLHGESRDRGGPARLRARAEAGGADPMVGAPGFARTPRFGQRSTVGSPSRRSVSQISGTRRSSG